MISKDIKLKPRLFVDMDGTLAEFKTVDTLEKLYEPGYFLKLKPLPAVAAAVGYLAAQGEVEVYVLSAVLSDSQYARQEKNEWLDRHLPEVDKTHRIFTACGKNKLLAVPGGWRSTDLLLDDYTQNLTQWEPPARGLKLMNGINGTHGTWHGHRVEHNVTSMVLVAQIIEQIRDQSVPEWRVEELRECWSSETNDDWTQEWRDELTPSEQALVDNWDNRYEIGIQNMAKDWRAVETPEKPTVQEKLDGAKQTAAERTGLLAKDAPKTRRNGPER